MATYQAPLPQTGRPLQIEQVVEALRQRAITALAAVGLTAAASVLAQLVDGGAVLRAVLSLGLHVLLEPWLIAQLSSVFT